MPGRAVIVPKIAPCCPRNIGANAISTGQGLGKLHSFRATETRRPYPVSWLKEAKIMIWVPFWTSLAIKMGQVALMLMAGKLNTPLIAGFGIVYMAIFGYLFWLHSQSKRYSAKA